MANYFWSANGTLHKKNMIEHFSVRDDSFCIDTICLNKEELIQLKELLPNFNILERSDKLSNLSEYEIQLFIKEIFGKLIEGDEITRKNLLKKYFVYGLYDSRTAGKLPFLSRYNKIDFKDIYLNLDKIKFQEIRIPEDLILDILNRNYFNMSDKIKIYMVNGDVNNIGISSYYTKFNTLDIQLIKVSSLTDDRWRILMYDDALFNDMIKDQNLLFTEKYKMNFENINTINNKTTITITELRTLIENMRKISILDGNFDYKIFKNELLVGYYKKILDLSQLHDDELLNYLYNPTNFKEEIFEDLDEEKENLGFFELSNVYYLMENQERFKMMLIYGKNNSSDINRWFILYYNKE